MILLNSLRLDRFENSVDLHGKGDAKVAGLYGLLDQTDRQLVELALNDGLTHRQMAMATGMSPGTVSRKLRRLVNRLHDPMVTALSDPRCTLSPEHRQIAVEYFVRRLSLDLIATRHHTNRTEIRANLEFIRGWFRGLGIRR